MATEFAAAAALASTAGSIKQAHTATKAQEKARDTQQAQADLQARRERSEQLRQSRMQRARIENVAAQTGTEGSAGAMGATSAISSQTNANLSFLDQSRQLATQQSRALQDAATARARSGVYQNITSFALPFADFSMDV
jgi:hypothetical protein